MTVAGTLMYTVAVPAIREYPTAESLATRVVVALTYAMGAVWLSGIADVGRRRRWRLHNLLGIELRQLREKLFDLLPMEVAQKMLRIPAVVPCETCRAAVLQMDVCGFTALSQSLPPLEVRRLARNFSFTSFHCFSGLNPKP